LVRRGNLLHMKPLSLLFALAMFGLLGCSTPSHTNFVPKSQGTVRDIDIRSAEFGTGTNVADVTGRVIHLLRSDTSGFMAGTEALEIDPLPYSSKCLIIDYYYQNKPYRFAVVGKQHVSYELLVKNATR